MDMTWRGFLDAYASAWRAMRLGHEKEYYDIQAEEAEAEARID